MWIRLQSNPPRSPPPFAAFSPAGFLSAPFDSHACMPVMGLHYSLHAALHTSMNTTDSSPLKYPLPTRREIY
ncbi:UNVERIFIED_CONTAM: hypothetical protein FKN15_001436 [Acipenser sinensis]